MLSSLASKWQDFKIEMPFFQPLYVMKLKTSKFKVLVFCCQWRYHYQIQITSTIKIKYWNASGSGFTPSLIPALQNMGILHHKKAKLPKHLLQSVCLCTYVKVLSRPQFLCCATYMVVTICFAAAIFFGYVINEIKPKNTYLH